MISHRLQAFAVIGVIIFLICLILLLKKNRISVQYAILWLFSGFVMLVFAVFPGLLDRVSNLIGIYSPVNALFGVVLFCGLIIMISFTAIITKDKREIVRLVQEMSILEERVRQLESRDSETESRNDDV